VEEFNSGVKGLRYNKKNVMNKIAHNKQYLLKVTTMMIAEGHHTDDRKESPLCTKHYKSKSPKLCEGELYNPYTIFYKHKKLEFCLRLVTEFLVYLRISWALAYISHIHT
jgi:hypothetical protein